MGRQWVCGGNPGVERGTSGEREGTRAEREGWRQASSILLVCLLMHLQVSLLGVPVRRGSSCQWACVATARCPAGCDVLRPLRGSGHRLHMTPVLRLTLPQVWQAHCTLQGHTDHH